MSLFGITVSFLKRRIIQPVANLLKQGMTPHKLAVTVAMGTVVGVVPAIGITTVMGTALAARFRLNIAATVLISYLMQPLQIILIIPFARLGIFIFGLQELRFSLNEITAMFKEDWLNALNLIWKANLAAVASWALLAVPVGFVLYLLVLPLLIRFMPKQVQA
ncbi:DUF2062 domain-containing protein [Pontibacter cellulosilyticus]|uniref:DUF2062 domain-containing protein n=1 Tax=Pontibacter cellulosilyticus TaxID=1720253 RepID=A0A923N3K7_9BACT|nr:DUF2062 domain-containing protein [Pontibacter cellulosilyticus]MBC5991534.1 DUF2062 domain-containing protein [Pontibacter cellulosilyticus]